MRRTIIFYISSDSCYDSVNFKINLEHLNIENLFSVKTPFVALVGRINDFQRLTVRESFNLRDNMSGWVLFRFVRGARTVKKMFEVMNFNLTVGNWVQRLSINKRDK